MASPEIEKQIDEQATREGYAIIKHDMLRIIPKTIVRNNCRLSPDAHKLLVAKGLDA